MVSTIGGVLLCVGAFFTMQGRVYWAVGTYLIADLCWIALAVQNSDVSGIFFTTLGTILGTIAFIKMFFGYMNKDIIKHGN